jgi:gliding motility-associated-like protein
LCLKKNRSYRKKELMPRILIYIALLIFSLSATAQVQLTPVLVGSAGGFYTYSGGSISASVGEALITTVGNGSSILTQGFHQPRMMALMELQITAYNATCKGSNDGAVKVNVSGGTAPYFYEYEKEDPLIGFVPYLPATLSPLDTLDSLSMLPPGNYRLIVTDLYLNQQIDTFSINVQFEGDCELKIYSGISPNGDGVNDTWIIDGIQFYPDNSVSLYNRWGDLIWEGIGYDNQSVVWDGTWKQTGEKVVNGTYFYLVNIPGKQFKGWVELTR